MKEISIDKGVDFSWPEAPPWPHPYNSQLPASSFPNLKCRLLVLQ